MANTINVNIWDDYYEDGYVPDGEKQETYIYIEDTSIPHDQRKKYLEYLMHYFKLQPGLNDLKMWMNWYDSKEKYPNLVGEEYESLHFQRWEIRVEDLTHKRRLELLDKLDKTDLTYDDKLFNIYSES